VAARLRSPGRRRGPPSLGDHAARDDGRRRTRRAHRPRADPAGWIGHGRRDARTHADGRGVAPGPVPRRAHSPSGRVLQQAAGLGDRRPVPDPGPDACHRRIGHRRDRGSEALGSDAYKAHQPDCRAGGGRRGHGRSPRRRDLLRCSGPPAQRTGLHPPGPRMRETASSEPAARDRDGAAGRLPGHKKRGPCGIRRWRKPGPPASFLAGRVRKRPTRLLPAPAPPLPGRGPGTR
jgi:hypothetical protein